MAGGTLCFCRRDPLNGYNNRALAIESESARGATCCASVVHALVLRTSALVWSNCYGERETMVPELKKATIKMLQMIQMLQQLMSG